MTKKQKIFARIVFGIYLAWLVWLILFKLWLPGYPALRGGVRSVEWIPFAERAAGFSQVLWEMRTNLLVFIPFGAYCAAFLPEKRRWAAFPMGFAVSVTLEVLQYITALGASDVTDVILNTAGSALGVLLWILLRRLFRSRAITVMNAAGLLGEILFLVAMAVLFVRNAA